MLKINTPDFVNLIKHFVKSHVSVKNQSNIYVHDYLMHCDSCNKIFTLDNNSVLTLSQYCLFRSDTLV